MLIVVVGNRELYEESGGFPQSRDYGFAPGVDVELDIHAPMRTRLIAFANQCLKKLLNASGVMKTFATILAQQLSAAVQLLVPEGRY
jgi:hypothetical protein